MNDWSESSDEGADFRPLAIYKITYYETRGDVALDRGDTSHAEEMYETALQEARSLLKAVNDHKDRGLVPREERAVEQIETNLLQIESSLRGELEKL